jgi:hypothetical protein
MTHPQTLTETGRRAGAPPPLRSSAKLTLWEFEVLARRADVFAQSEVRTSVAPGATAELFSFTVPQGKIGFLKMAFVQSDNFNSISRILLGDRVLLETAEGAATFDTLSNCLLPFYAGVAVRGVGVNTSAIPNSFRHSYLIFFVPDREVRS